MSGTKRKGSGEIPDVSHHPTRKVDSMSSLVAEMLLRDPDADATSPGLPAVNAAALDPANESDAHDAVGLDMARLIEVRSSVAPGPPAAPVAPGTSAIDRAEDSAAIRAFRSRKPRVVAVIVVLCVVGGAVAAALSLSR
jgi:hypothetical protein